MKLNNIAMITNSETCSACRIMENRLKEAEIELAQVHDVMSPAGCVAATNYRVFGGIPCFVNIRNPNFRHTGTCDVEKIIELNQDEV